MSNFDMMKDEWSLLGHLGETAEYNVYRDPNVTLVKIRQFAESMVEAIFSLEQIEVDSECSLIKRLRILELRNVLEPELLEVFHNIRKHGNLAVHTNYGDFTTALNSVRWAHFLANWFMEVYVSYDYEGKAFSNPEKLQDNPNSTIDELNEKIKLLEAILESERLDYGLKLQKLSKNSGNIINKNVTKVRRSQSQKYLKNKPLSEKETRLNFIDEQLRNAGWLADTDKIAWSQGERPEKNKNKAIAEVPVNGGYADYALFIGLDLVGIIEAKQYNFSIAGHIEQAKTYAKNIKDMDEYEVPFIDGEYKVPFIYATNGRSYIEQFKEQSGIWFWDSRYPEKTSFPLEGWHSPDDLKEKLKVDENKANAELINEPYPDFVERYYQIEAIKAVEKGLADNKRRMLLAMATGTGKTRLAIALMYRLIKTKRVRRVLFLVDRRSLGIQAADALGDIKIENLSVADIYDVKSIGEPDPETATKIHISTVQGMVKRLFYSDDRILSVGTYDFIIVDEAHRGYLYDKEMTDDEILFRDQQEYISQYRRVIDYFDATVVGLTATPALHTTKIFNAPIYTYSYSDAVIDGFLVDHEPPYRFETELLKNGITFAAKSDVDIWDEEKKVFDKAYLEDELSFEVDNFNKKVITEDFNKVILEKLTDYLDTDDDGKTLIFAANDLHADMVVRLLKKAYEDKGIPVHDDAIIKITGYIKNPEEAIKRFKNEKYPNIVVTVDLLTTGIDVPKIINLVFLRRVRSRILYDQMLGRATRLCPKIGKTSFYIFDAVHLYEHLKNITDMKPVVVNTNLSLMELYQRALDATDNETYEYFKNELIAKMQQKKQRIDRTEENNIEISASFGTLDSWLLDLKSMSQKQLGAEKDKIDSFDRLHTNSKYPNIKYISKHPDKLLEVIQTYGPKNMKPNDYLEEFSKFINDNINKIAALNIIVNRPKDLTFNELRSIQLELKRNHYDENMLNSAWQKAKKEYIVADIISFIRQAAIGSALVSHETRIENAMEKVYNMKSWTPKQMEWLKRIRAQLLSTPVLAPTAQVYFDETTVWREKGGYNGMKRRIGEDIDKVIELLNDELYIS